MNDAVIEAWLDYSVANLVAATVKAYLRCGTKVWACSRGTQWSPSGCPAFVLVPFYTSHPFPSLAGYDPSVYFCLPKVIKGVNTFLASHYLRAMAIWGLWATHTDWQVIPGSHKG